MRIQSVLLVSAVIARTAFAVESKAPIDQPTMEVVMKAVLAYVQKDIEVKGTFLALHPKSGSPLALDFESVHQDVKLRGDDCVACVGFRDRRGKLYEVDVLLGKAGVHPEPFTWGGIEIRKVLVHKIDGKPVGGAGE